MFHKQILNFKYILYANVPLQEMKGIAAVKFISLKCKNIKIKTPSDKLPPLTGGFPHT